MNQQGMRRVGDIMKRHIVSVALEDDYDKVISILQAYHLSCVPVLDHAGRCFGVLTTRDVLKKTEAIQRARIRSAWEQCTCRAIEVEPDTPLESAANLFLEHRVHHLVVKDGGAVVGIVSALDLVALLVGARDGTTH